MKAIGIATHPGTGEQVALLDKRRGIYRCTHRFIFRHPTKDEGWGYMVCASKRAADHLWRCQIGFVFAWRADRGVTTH